MAAIDIVVVICAILMCGFPGLTNYILTNHGGGSGGGGAPEVGEQGRSALLGSISPKNRAAKLLEIALG